MYRTHALHRMCLITPVFALIAACGGLQAGHDTGHTVMVKTSPPDQAEMMMRSMHKYMQATSKHLHEARANVHVRRMVCVGEALSIIRSTVKIANGSHLDYMEARARGDHDAAERAFIKIGIAHARVDNLHGQTMGCGGVSPG